MNALSKTLSIAVLSGSLFATAAEEIPGMHQAPEEVSRTTWGWNLGGVVTEIPISQAIDSGFAVLMSNIYYSHYLGDPRDYFRTAATLGLYGFQIILPVPYAALDFYLGEPVNDIQFKGSVGGFYDITVGGHGGIAVGAGVLFKNRVNFSFFMVPFGKDADRDYLEFVGDRDVAKACTKDDPCVETPYFGLFVGFQY